MHLYSVHGVVHKYNDVDNIVNEFYEHRLKLYQKRKDYLLAKLQKEMDIFEE